MFFSQQNCEYVLKRTAVKNLNFKENQGAQHWGETHSKDSLKRFSEQRLHKKMYQCPILFSWPRARHGATNFFFFICRDLSGFFRGLPGLLPFFWGGDMVHEVTPKKREDKWRLTANHLWQHATGHEAGCQAAQGGGELTPIDPELCQQFSTMQVRGGKKGKRTEGWAWPARTCECPGRRRPFPIMTRSELVGICWDLL